MIVIEGPRKVKDGEGMEEVGSLWKAGNRGRRLLGPKPKLDLMLGLKKPDRRFGDRPTGTMLFHPWTL